MQCLDYIENLKKMSTNLSELLAYVCCLVYLFVWLFVHVRCLVYLFVWLFAHVCCLVYLFMWFFVRVRCLVYSFVWFVCPCTLSCVFICLIVCPCTLSCLFARQKPTDERVPGPHQSYPRACSHVWYHPKGRSDHRPRNHFHGH